jgi:quercetin dioxygenase-like cupin family protein
VPIDESGNALLTLNEMKWIAGPPTLPAGMRMFLIEGDPREAGPFTMRLWFPAGTRVAPRFHPGVKHVTVISGSAHWGMGERFEANQLRTMPAGSFIMICAGSPHFGQTTEDTVIQAHGTGPWRTIYVNPADDPAASAGGR